MQKNSRLEILLALRDFFLYHYQNQNMQAIAESAEKLF